MAAPLLPLVTEEIWRGLTGERSVHLTDWPDAGEFPRDHELVTSMDAVREIASSALALRKARNLRVRLPLAKLTVVARDATRIEAFSDILSDELNVKVVELAALHDDSLGGYGITRRLSVNARALGPRLGRDVQRIIQKAKSGEWRIDLLDDGEAVFVDETLLEHGEYELELVAADPASAIAFLPGGGFVVLDTALTPELEAEGLARDVVRAVQQARKDAGLEVGDRISLVLSGDASAMAAMETHRDLIAGETLATSLDAREAGDGTVPVGADSRISIGVERA